jgi:hypothetical protein
MVLTYFATGSKANFKQSVNVIGHDLAPGSRNHPKDDNGSPALLPRNFFVAA